MAHPELGLYIGQKVVAITQGAEKWEWGIKLESGTEIRNKDVRETFQPMGLVNMRFQSMSLDMKGTVLHFMGGGASKVSVGLKPTGYVIYDPRYGDEIFPQWPEELDEMGITANEGMAPPNPKPIEDWRDEEARLKKAQVERIASEAREFIKDTEES